MKKTVKDLKEDIAELNDKFDGLRSRFDKDGAEKMTDDELKEMRSYPDELRKLTDDLGVLQAVETRSLVDAAGRMANVTPGVGNTNISDAEVRDFSQVSLGAALAQLAKYGELRGLEKEVDDYARRDALESGFGVLGAGFAMPSTVGKMEMRGQTATGQNSTAGDQGGVYVPTEIAPFIGSLWSDSIAGQVGATRFTDLSGKQSFPVQTSKPTAQDLTEIQAMSADEILWTSILMDGDRKGTNIPIARKLIIQGKLDTQAFVIDNLRRALAYKLDVDIKNTLMALTPIALGTNGAALDWDKVVALETAVSNNDANTGAVKYLTNTKVRGSLKTLKKDAGSGMFLMEGGQLNGYDVAVSNVMPSNLTKGTASGICSSMVFGNFADLYIGFWGGTVFNVMPEPGTDQIRIYVNAYWDTAVARNASFATYKDILA